MNIVFFLNRQNLINWTNQNLILLCERSSSRWSYQRLLLIFFLSFFFSLIIFLLYRIFISWFVLFPIHLLLLLSASFPSFLPCISISHLLFIYIQFHPTFKKGSVHAKNEEKRVNCDTEKSKRSFYNIRRINALPLPLNFHPLTRFIIIPASK